MSTRTTIYAIAGLAALAVGSAAASEAPVGLIMSVSGSVSPDVAPYTEVSADSRIALGDSGKLTFIHYPSCRLVAVTGGVLMFTQQDVQLEGGSVDKETPQRCPKQLKMKIAGVAGGVRLRSIPTAALGPKPVCTLIGARNRAFAQARVLLSDQLVASFAVDGPTLAWPASQAALEAGRMYRLELTPKLPGDKPMGIDFTVVGDATSGATECLLRVE